MEEKIVHPGERCGSPKRSPETPSPAGTRERLKPQGRQVDEWIGAHPDTAVPRHVRARIFQRCGGKCHISGRVIRPGEPWDLDHITALEDGGEHRELNLAPALRDKHREKTAAENTRRAKERERFQNHNGIKRKRTGFRAWRKFNGEIVRRDER